MSAPAIVIGDPNGILRLPKAGLRTPGEWTQLDSDIIAHLIQVASQIQQSRWYKSDARFTTCGEQLTDHSFPAFEDFVFAAVYLRQLTAKKDHLLKDAVDRYCRFVDCPLRPAWLRYELDAFVKFLTGRRRCSSGVPPALRTA